MGIRTRGRDMKAGFRRDADDKAVRAEGQTVIQRWNDHGTRLPPVGTLVVGLRCSWCPGSAPMPKLVGLFALPPARRAETA